MLSFTQLINIIVILKPVCLFPFSPSLTLEPAKLVFVSGVPGQRTASGINAGRLYQVVEQCSMQGERFSGLVDKNAKPREILAV